MRLSGRGITNSIFVSAVGIALFAVGIAILYFNPFWRLELHSTGAIDHRAFICSAIGHLIAGLGLMCSPGGATVATLLFLGRRTRPKKLYWSVVILASCLTLAWVVTSGSVAYYRASFHWASNNGATVLGITALDRDFPNWFWHTIVSWQIKPDLNGYCSLGGILDSTDGAVTITVARIVPVVTQVDLGLDGESLRNVKRKHSQPAAAKSPHLN